MAASAIVLCASRAGAQSKDKCSRAYEQAQVLRQDGKLVEAQNQLLVCAAHSCPSKMREECATWSAEVQKEMPTVVVSFRTADGADVTGARLLIDGRVAAESLGGTGIAIDPGQHVLRVEAPGHPAQERKIVTAVGDRLRKVEFVVKAAAKPKPVSPPLPKPTPVVPPAASPKPIPASVWVLGAVGAAGVGVGAYFGFAALSKRSDLGSCKPNCAQQDVDLVNRDYIVSEVAIGAGLAAIGAAAFIALDSRRASPTVGFSFDPHGAGAAFRGSF